MALHRNDLPSITGRTRETVSRLLDEMAPCSTPRIAADATITISNLRRVVIISSTGDVILDLSD